MHIKELTKKAKAGDADAQYEMGERFGSHVKGVRYNRKAARKWYLESAKQGHKEAQYLTAIHFCMDKDYAMTVEWLTLAANQGHAGAMYGLGHCYDGGYGVPMDKAKASELIKMATMAQPKDELRRRFYWDLELRER